MGCTNSSEAVRQSSAPVVLHRTKTVAKPGHQQLDYHQRQLIIEAAAYQRTLQSYNNSKREPTVQSEATTKSPVSEEPSSFVGDEPFSSEPLSCSSMRPNDEDVLQPKNQGASRPLPPDAATNGVYIDILEEFLHDLSSKPHVLEAHVRASHERMEASRVARDAHELRQQTVRQYTDQKKKPAAMVEEWL